MPIRTLPPEVALRIAAGEVVTRPSDAVKELVENSIDAVLVAASAAGASYRPRIDIELKGGGLQMIRVADNGAGISADEAALAFLRHSTSKIASEEDLRSIHTLGFRGEALASIAAISRVVMFTRASGADTGLLLSLDWGQAIGQSPRGGPVGTSITVHDLFQNVPARLRFLRSSLGEAGRVAQVVSQLALAYPGVQMSLVSDGRTVLSTPGGGDLLAAIAKVLDPSIVGRMLAVGAGTGEVRLSGFVGEADLHRATRSGMSLFINRRWIQSRSLQHAVIEAYQPALPGGRFPVVALFVDVPPSDLDVNVHPTKAEVRLVDERVVYSLVRRAVREALMTRAPLPEVGARLSPAGMPQDMEDVFATGPAVAAGSKSNDSEARRQAELSTRPDLATDAQASEGSVELSRQTGLPILHPLGQVQRTYIVAEGPDGVYFVDQHTAHERIRYEEILAQRKEHGVASQRLLQPLEVGLSARQRELLIEHQDEVHNLGFELDLSNPVYCELLAAPVLVRPDHLAEVISSLADALAAEDPAEGIDRLSATVACHSAVRAGDPLTTVEMRELLQRLEGLDVWRYCPHGRPIAIRLDAAQLARDFHRV